MRRAGATLPRGARASHCCGLSCCGAQAPDAQAQQLWLTGLLAPRHFGSSQTRARTRVPCIGRQILTTAPPGKPLNFFYLFIYLFIYLFWLRWVFVAARGLSLVVARGGYSRCSAQASHCSGFPCYGARALGARASVDVARGLSSCGLRARSEERRVGKECRSRWSPYH